MEHELVHHPDTTRFTFVCLEFGEVRAFETDVNGAIRAIIAEDFDVVVISEHLTQEMEAWMCVSIAGWQDGFEDGVEWSSVGVGVACDEVLLERGAVIVHELAKHHVVDAQRGRPVEVGQAVLEAVGVAIEEHAGEAHPQARFVAARDDALELRVCVKGLDAHQLVVERLIRVGPADVEMAQASL